MEDLAASWYTVSNAASATRFAFHPAVEPDVTQEGDMELDSLGPVFAIALLLAALALYLVAFYRRSNTLLEKWADDHGYELLSAQFRLLRKGPYWWSSRAQTVYRVEILDGEGDVRSGWWMGVFGDQVEAKLDT